MNFSGSGWLKKYIDFRSKHPFPDQLPSNGMKVLEDSTQQHHQLDEAIYYFLQPTGLFYGFPVSLPFPDVDIPELRYMDAGEKGHLIFLEAMFACLIADRAFLLEDLVDDPDHFSSAVSIAVEFYNGIKEHSSGGGSKISVGKVFKWKRTPADHFEKEISKLIGGQSDFLNLPGFFYNSFLFLDLYFCMLWQRNMLMDPDNKEKYLAELAEKQLIERRQLIRLMIAAASVSGGIVNEERRLIEWFLKSSNLPKKDSNALRKEIKQGVSLDDIVIEEMPWLVRRFFLEAVMMTILVDRDLSEGEKRFLGQVVVKLGLWEEELEQSLVALEVFLLNKEDSLHILKKRSMVFNVGDNLREKASRVVRKNMNRIVNEIHETQDLYNLLIKSTSTSLTKEEKERVKNQLSDILKTIPTLAIFALPGGGIILPVLIKLLPFNLLPSSFED